MPIRVQKARVSRFIGMKPPLLTRTSQVTRSGQVMASRAAAKPPTELPMNTAVPSASGLREVLQDAGEKPRPRREGRRRGV